MRGFAYMFVFGVVACVVAGEGSVSDPNCSVKPLLETQLDRDFKSMTTKCADKMKAQVNMELQAALTYMAMGAHFSLDTVNRPGFAKMFFESASEERDHAFKIIDYLLMRGLGDSIMKELIKPDLAAKEVTWKSPLHAMKNALELEIEVTKSITDIIKVCENGGKKDVAKDSPKELFNNDFHLVDYLTGDFLEEQLNGQRELAGKIATLGKMMDTQGPLAEFLFDKNLL